MPDAARKVLDDPPPLTPTELRHFPYTLHPFLPVNFFTDAGLSRLTSTEPPVVPPSPASRVE